MKTPFCLVLGLLIFTLCAATGSAGYALNHSCNASAECDSKSCSDGICCNAGECSDPTAARCYSNGEDLQTSMTTILACRNGTWKRAYESSCSSDTECVTGKCVNGACCNGNECAYSYMSPMVCVKIGENTGYPYYKVCVSEGVWKKGNNQSCTNGTECISERCSDGICCNAGECGYNQYKRCIADGQELSVGPGVAYYCANGTRLKAHGSFCSGAGECITGKCINGACCDAGECAYQYQAPFKFCVGIGGVSGPYYDVCTAEGVWKTGNERPCTMDDNCASQNCVNLVCCNATWCGYGGKCYSSGSNYGSTMFCMDGKWRPTPASTTTSTATSTTSAPTSTTTSSTTTSTSSTTTTTTTSTTTTLSCRMLWWFDGGHNTSCGYREFCGAYMYLGLRTFDTQTECAAYLPKTCIGEGLTAIVYPGATDCCPELRRISITRVENGQCMPAAGAVMCAHCGNGVCGIGENWCNCPADCQKDDVTTTSSTSSTTSTTLECAHCTDGTACDKKNPAGQTCKCPVMCTTYKDLPGECMRICRLMNFFTTTTMAQNCRNLWWFDNTNNRSCGYREFCDAYAYLGLRTFATYSECAGSIPQGNTSRDSDINGDGSVDYRDILIFAAAYGKQAGQNGFGARADILADGAIDYKDLLIFAGDF